MDSGPLFPFYIRWGSPSFAVARCSRVVNTQNVKDCCSSTSYRWTKFCCSQNSPPAEELRLHSRFQSSKHQAWDSLNSLWSPFSRSLPRNRSCCSSKGFPTERVLLSCGRGVPGIYPTDSNPQFPVGFPAAGESELILSRTNCWAMSSIDCLVDTEQAVLCRGQRSPSPLWQLRCCSKRELLFGVAVSSTMRTVSECPSYFRLASQEQKFVADFLVFLWGFSCCSLW